MGLAEELDKAIGRAALKVQAEVQKNCPVKTGRLRNSIVTDKVDGVWTVGTNLEYAEYVEAGAEPHVIRPKNKQFLRFQIGEKVIFTKQVNHPGQSGKFMFLNASRKAQDFLDAELKKLK